MKAGKAAGLSELSVEMIAASGEIRIGVMVELCQGVLDGRGMLDEWALSVVVPIFKGKGDAMSCGAYRGGEVIRACNEDGRKGAREEIAAYGESGRDAIWCYARLKVKGMVYRSCVRVAMLYGSEKWDSNFEKD